MELKRSQYRRGRYKTGKNQLYPILLRSLLCLAKAAKPIKSIKPPTRSAKTAKASRATDRQPCCQSKRKPRRRQKRCPIRRRPAHRKPCRSRRPTCRPKQRRKLSHPVVWRSTDNSTVLWDPSTRTASVENILDPGTRSPPVENASQLTEKECCGNFLIQENQTSPQLLWMMSPGLQAELTQVSLFNDTSSSGSIQMTIAGDRSSFVMQIEPGTTGTYTDRNIGSIHVALTGSKPGIAEGKYIVTAFFRLGERKSG